VFHSLEIEPHEPRVPFKYVRLQLWFVAPLAVALERNLVFRAAVRGTLGAGRFCQPSEVLAVFFFPNRFCLGGVLPFFFLRCGTVPTT